MRFCDIEGCDKRHLARGLCGMHYRRMRVHGDPTITLPASGGSREQRGVLNASWKGSEITYLGAHARVRRARGDARDDRCPCGSTAKEWAYDHADVDEMTDPIGRPYSTDPAHYVPMCVPCHRRFDRRKERTAA